MNILEKLQPLSARYDIMKKEIQYCKPGTLIYYHEERHKIQDNWGLVANAFACLLIPFIIISFICIFNPKFWILFIYYYFFIYTILEIDAWIYSFKKFKETKNARKKE